MGRVVEDLTSEASLLAIRMVGGEFGTSISRNDNVGEVKPILRRAVTAKKDSGSGHAESFKVQVNFSLEMESAGDDHAPLAWVEARFELDYYWPGIHEVPLSDGDLSTFGEATAVFNAWPYMREFVHSSMARMDLPIFTIPLLNRQPVASLEVSDQDQTRRPA